MWLNSLDKWKHWAFKDFFLLTFLIFLFFLTCGVFSFVLVFGVFFVFWVSYVVFWDFFGFWLLGFFARGCGRRFAGFF